jgi:hypothetical protein
MKREATKEQKKRTTVNPWDYYTQRNFSIFPTAQNKKPIEKWKHFKDRYPTADEIAEWEKSGFNIAIATGALSDLVIVDADSAEAVRELEALNSDGVKVPLVRTPRGGRHYYCRFPTELPGNQANRGKSEKIDLRSEGGYALAPPGRTKDGKYEWDEELNLDKVPIPMMPRRWRFMFLHARLSSELRKEIEPGPRLVQGRRDNDIFHMAIVWRRDGYSREEAEEMAVLMARKCDPPFDEQEALKKVESAWSRPLRDKYRRAEEVDPSIPMSYRMSDVVEEEMTWLWKNYIPSESITLLSGDPNAGKTWWALDLACKVSRGARWADGAAGNAPANVYYMTYEDSLSKQLKKRIRTLGGDASRITAYNSKHPLHLTLSTPEGIERLENDLIRVGVVNGGLLVTDPILDFTGDSNPNAVEIVRGLLTPIVAMLERLKIACLMVGHLNKDQMKSAMYRSGGSTGGWMGKARAAFLVARDPEGSSTRYVVPIKYNYAWPEPVKMEFSIIEGKLLFEITDIDIDEVLNPKRGRRPERREAAITWLEAQFEGREEIPSSQIEEQARRDGISMSTLKKVKTDAGYQSIRKFGEDVDIGIDRWVWRKT